MTKYSYIISYDLRKTKDYDAIFSKIRSYGTYSKILESVWFIKSEKNSTEIRDDLKKVIDSDDGIFVAKLTGQAAWTKVISTDQFLKDNL